MRISLHIAALFSFFDALKAGSLEYWLLINWFFSIIVFLRGTWISTL